MALFMLLLAVAVPARATDAKPTTFWKSLAEKGMYERVWEKLRLYEKGSNSVTYAGLSYLIFGDRSKLMTGAEYSAMRDDAHDGGAFNGWTFLTGSGRISESSSA